jgi:transposase-like protein
LTLVEAIESGMTLRAAAAALNVAPATAHRWWHRHQQASAEERRSRSWLLDRRDLRQIFDYRHDVVAREMSRRT